MKPVSKKRGGLMFLMIVLSTRRGMKGLRLD